MLATSLPTRVTSPTAVAQTAIGAATLTVPAWTCAPGATSIGRDSPVRTPRSIAERPATTSPSTGMISPTRTRTTSPGTIASIGTSVAAPSGRSGPRRWARLGVSDSKSSAAVEARRW